MPSPRDITGDLVRMRSRKPLRDVDPHAEPEPSVAMRPMAADPVLWIAGVVVLVGLALQGAFIIWMW